ncbi:MAG: hypothetical protein Q7W29_04275 [bacterium]|nr:hypothetical protein [bacterium]
MTRLADRIGWHPTTATLIGATLVIGGILLAEISWWFVALSGVGAFGPGILRELGWLRDNDEFARRAAQRAGYHAYLAAGLAAFVMIAYIRSGERHLKHPEELSTLFLVLLYFTWLLSSLLSFWGARKAASRILIGFGIAWLMFCVADSWQQPLGLLMHSLVAAPFFLLAALARRWPRIAGALLVGAGVFFYVFFDFYSDQRGGLINNSVTAVLLVGPLVASGAALLGDRERHAAQP